MMQDEKGIESEIWKPIPEFDGIYEISSYGSVRRVYKNKIKVLTPKITNNIAIYYHLSFNKASYYITAHKTVAQIFLNNPDKKLYVGFRDGNRYNLNKNNLKWVDHPPKNTTATNRKFNNLSEKQVISIRLKYDRFLEGLCTKYKANLGTIKIVLAGQKHQQL